MTKGRISWLSDHTSIDKKTESGSGGCGMGQMGDCFTISIISQL